MSDLRPILLVEDSPKDLALERVKGDPKLRHIPVVMLTSSRQEQDLAHSYELWVDAFVVRPVEFTKSFKAIEDLGVSWAILTNRHQGRDRA